MPEVERFEVERDSLARAGAVETWMVVRYAARGPTARGEKVARGLSRELAARVSALLSDRCPRTEDGKAGPDGRTCGAALPCVRHEHPSLAACADPGEGRAPEGAKPGIIACTAHRLWDVHAGRPGIDLSTFDRIRWHIVTRDGRIEVIDVETHDRAGFVPGVCVRGSHTLGVLPHASNTIRVRPLSPMEEST